MHQERDGGAPEEIRQQQEDRRLKPIQAENQQQQQQQPQKCPRCESLNTKFCYYNNYSLSQPRYFCKACRRYWTQGGTLRNVPVGGGCRKGKRAKTSSSSGAENSRSQQPQQIQQNLTNRPAIIPSNPVNTTSPILTSTEPAGNLATPSIQSIAPYYAGGGYLSSLAAIQSLSQSHSFSTQALDVGGDLGSSSNLDLLQGFAVPSFGSQQQQQIQHRQFYQMSNRDRNVESDLYPTEETLSQSSRPPSSSHDWHQNFLYNTNPVAPDTTLWSISTIASTTAAGYTNSNNNGGSTSNPGQWPHDLPGYGPPP
ncbi:hypothetical protein F2P56_006325 [Juglans regia]|uniref:Dof zinc finger protein n=2 Tax=Juglans regia TaxID=51240 RepID=A0A6P9E6V4_JUGRE|nr:dof zinc finger protein DOF1.6-like isoform X1 [Juglans regia]XP_035543896.1 dof zinc finger protein DOF1.6-like isoform X1 [Juglans regia]KAF5474425.1 hypothetical protein F2P56_006325 [Juglans regia]